MTRFIFKVLILTVLFSCNNNNQNLFTIDGKTDRVGDAILLKLPAGNQIDTTSIKKGKFVFKHDIKEEELFRIKFHDGSAFDILANKGEKIKI